MKNCLFSAQKFWSQKISKLSASLFMAATLAVLAGCGSGPGNPSDTQNLPASGAPATPAIPATPGVPTLTLALSNAAGAAVTTISIGAPATVQATLKDAAGAVVPDSVVTFSTDATLATISPAATALTDGNGVAAVTLNPATILTAGATTIAAAAQVGTTAVTGSIGFTVGIAAVTVSAPVLGVGLAPLSAFGTTSISVTVSIGGAPVTTPQSVTFSSSCASVGKAVLSTGVATVAGTATGSYRDNGCAGTDVITASAAGVTSASTSLVVSAPTTGSIQFVSATPSSISLRGIGGTEAAQVRFKVLDGTGNPISGKIVTFGLSTTVGGITLTPPGTPVPPAPPPTAISDAGGLVVTTVNSGTVSTPVRVTASTPGPTGTTLTTQSSALTITTGIPDQDSFSLSATKLNPEFRDIDGVTTVVTARLADHFNNPVPDGTVVNFTTEGGSIIASCSTVSSACSSTLTSQAPRPTDGRVTVLAYAVGEESFIDLNGNGVADVVPNELIEINGASTDMPEAFRDDNENGVRDANETFIDFNQNGAYDAADGQFSGVLCDSAKSSAGTCSSNKTIHVRSSIVIVFSGSAAVISKIAPAGTIDLGSTPGAAACSGKSQQVDLRIVDVGGNPMPVGTTIAITTTNGTLSGTSTFTQVNTNVTLAAGAANYSVSVRDDATIPIDSTTGLPFGTCKDTTQSGVLTVTVTTPGAGGVPGTVTTAQFPVLN